MRLRVAGLALGLLGFVAGVAQADPAVGIWRTEPDRKDLVSHIQVSKCGAALCGTVREVFDAAGRAITTPNLGQRLFWDMRPLGGGAYAGGTVQVASMNITARAEMTLADNRLKVTGCKGPACYTQTWRRVARP